MDKYEQADKELAELLGWTDIKESKFIGAHAFAGKLNGESGYVPRWTLDDGECFRLAVEHDVKVNSNPSPNYVTCDILRGFPQPLICEVVKIEEDKLSATRMAIIQAVIAKLRQQGLSQSPKEKE